MNTSTTTTSITFESDCYRFHWKYNEIVRRNGPESKCESNIFYNVSINLLDSLACYFLFEIHNTYIFFGVALLPIRHKYMRVMKRTVVPLFVFIASLVDTNSFVMWTLFMEKKVWDLINVTYAVHYIEHFDSFSLKLH